MLQAHQEGWTAGHLVIELRSRGIPVTDRTAQRWLQGVREGRYRVVEASHKTTPLPLPDIDTIISLTERNREEFADVLESFDRSQGPVYMGVAADEHIPDHDPVAIELAQRIVADWFKGQDNTLLIRAGDLFDFPNLGRWKNLPITLREPGQPLADPLNFAMAHFESVQAGWKATGRAHELMLMGNHDHRFFMFLYEHATPAFEFNVITLVKKLNEHGILWLGLDQDRVLLRKDGRTGALDLKVLHGKFARKHGGTSIRGEAESDQYVYDTVQGHVHRSNSQAVRRGDGSLAQLFEVGCLCHLQPHWSKSTMNWQQGILLAAYHPSDLSEPAEYQNLLFVPQTYRDGRYLTARLDGMEYRVKYPSSQIVLEAVARGDFQKVVETDSPARCPAAFPAPESNSTCR